MTAMATQHVQRLVVERFKRITDVEIAPDTTTPTVLITGRNAQGKSSVLDALETVLTGVDKRRTPKPIHEGETTARIVAETDDLFITRTFKTTAKGTDSTLTIAARDGAKYSSPQKMLDELFGQVTVDPWHFATMAPKDQKATLLSLVDLPFDLDALDAKRAEAFAKRTDANRELKNLTAQVEAIQERLPADGANTQEVSAGDLITRIQKANTHAQELAQADRAAQEFHDRVRQLQAQLAQAETQRDLADARVEKLAEVQAEDPEELTAQLSAIEDTNREARANAAAFAEAERLEDLEHVAMAKAGELDLQIRDIDQRKADGLAAAEFPVPGLAFSEDGILYQGQPFEQASTAERIRVSFAVATARPGTIRVVLIRNAESLDSSNLELIGRLAAEKDMQVWMERVSETRELGVFHMEDGKIA